MPRRSSSPYDSSALFAPHFGGGGVLPPVVAKALAGRCWAAEVHRMCQHILGLEISLQTA